MSIISHIKTKISFEMLFKPLQQEEEEEEEVVY